MSSRELVIVHDRLDGLRDDLQQLMWDAYPHELDAVADRLDLLAQGLRTFADTRRSRSRQVS